MKISRLKGGIRDGGSSHMFECVFLALALAMLGTRLIMVRKSWQVPGEGGLSHDVHWKCSESPSVEKLL
jgi:hypothetical protein